MSWFLAALKKYATFDGRARRSEYWYFILFYLIIIIGLCVVDVLLAMFLGFGFLSILFALGMLIPSLAVAVRRLHDTGRSGWWILISLVPLVGGLILLYFLVLDSQPGDNAHGPNPKGAA